MNQPPVYQPPTTSNEVTYPTASAFLIDNDDNAASEQHKSNTLVSSNTGRNDYASAHIVDNPFSSELFTATPTQAFATDWIHGVKKRPQTLNRIMHTVLQ